MSMFMFVYLYKEKKYIRAINTNIFSLFALKYGFTFFPDSG